MGISGIFKELGNGERKALCALSSAHYTTHGRPLRLAIDISIWLFQIQSGRGGSNPALRTFYYRLLRLLSLNIHPLFVFDGPNKPLFKRNKRVGNASSSSHEKGKGGYSKVSTVPEFLAKQLLKLFGFPLHVAPGEAEAECALLQRNGVVDAVLSEDVDTLMFGCTMTLRNWTAAEGSSTKSPTHVNVYGAAETKARSGIDADGMILVAMMSGGDYLPDGVPGCGIKMACDAARAGFGRELCEEFRKGRQDDFVSNMQEWKDRLQHQIRTNEAKYFTRRLKEFTFPESFPSLEVLGWYVQPCVSNATKIENLRSSLKWDEDIDFAALRGFAADAFDWRNLGGAKKFIRNLAPAMLVRQVRLRSEHDSDDKEYELRAQEEKHMVSAVHSKRNHASTDHQLELRISFLPEALVPIDLSLEQRDDDFIAAGTVDSDVESEAPSCTQACYGEEEEGNQPETPRKRKVAPYDPTQKEKIWILSDFLKVGCPIIVEEWEASFRDAQALFQQRRQAKENGAKVRNVRAKRVAKGGIDMPVNALMRYASVVKAGSVPNSSSQREYHDCEVLDLSEGIGKANHPLKQIETTSVTLSEPKHQTISAMKSGLVKPLGSAHIDSIHNPAVTLSGFQLPATQSANLERRQRIFQPVSSASMPQHSSRTPKRAGARAMRSDYGVPTAASKGTSESQERKDRFFAMFSSQSSHSSASQPSIPSAPRRQQRKRSSSDLTSPLPSPAELRNECQQESIIRYCSVTPKQHSRFRETLRPEVPDLSDEEDFRKQKPGVSEENRKRRNAGITKRNNSTTGYDCECIRNNKNSDDDATLIPSPPPSKFSSSIIGDKTKHQPNLDILDLTKEDDFDDSNTIGTSIIENVQPVLNRSYPHTITSSRPITHDPLERQANEICSPPGDSVPTPGLGFARDIEPDTVTSARAPTPTSKLKSRNNANKVITLRASLPGAWKEVAIEEIDLTFSPQANTRTNPRPRSEKRTKSGKSELAWRKSGVEILDLTVS